MNIFIILISWVHITIGEYIRSDELILNDNLEIGSEIVNLNRLVNKPNSLFKIVNDTLLVNYIHLEYLNSDTTLILLKQKLNFDDICDTSLQLIEAKTVSSSIITCSQTLKIVAINENDFIEIPIEIRKINFIKKQKIGIKFKSQEMTLNLTSVENYFLIEQPIIIAEDQEPLKDKVMYKLNIDHDIITTKLDPKPDCLNLTLNFIDEKSLVKAYDFNVEFKLRLDAFFDQNLTDVYEIETNSSLYVTLKVSELKKLNLKPLDFEQPIYSIVIENKFLGVHDLILQPRLKTQTNESDIVFTLFQTESGTTEFPFYVEERTGSVRLKTEIWNEDDDYLNKNMNKNFLFGIKATYKRLQDTKNSKTNYYYDYMIPAFTKIQVNIRREKIELSQIKTDVSSPFISKYEILNKESSNQTFIYYINEPIKSGSKLVSFMVEFVNNLNSTDLEWILNDNINFKYTFNKTGLTIENRVEFRDAQVYKINLKFIEKIRNSKKFRVLNEVNVEFRIDFDPLLFERNEYMIELYASDLIEQKLVKINLKNRRVNQAENVVYRLIDSEDSGLFELDSTWGWLSAKGVLTKKLEYNLEILAVNSNVQKTATVKCKVKIDCSRTSKTGTLKFNLFENSPIGTQIGLFRSICSDNKFLYTIDQVQVFSIDSESGFLVTNDNLNSISDWVVLLNGSIKLDEYKTLIYPIEINLQKTPNVLNFRPKLSLIEDVPTNQTCLYSYNFMSNTNYISRFVRVDENMAHFEAEFKFSTTKFYITNTGCLNIRNDQLNKTEPILHSGVYNLIFKLCFYDRNKVSCSDFYNQSLQVPVDVYNASRIVLKQDLDLISRLELGNTNPIDLLNKSSLSVYLVVLLSVIGLVACVTVLFLVVLFSKPKGGVKSASEKALVIKQDFKNLEINTNIRSQPSANTPESSTATNSTKISKADDEDDIKIQVLDEPFKQLNFGYENNNFSYSGSFRSEGSSYESTEGVRSLKVDDQGLYSVKNASIQFQNQPEYMSPKPKDYEFYSDLKPESMTSDLTTYNCLLVNTTTSSSDQQSNPKTSSLKKIKKDMSIKRNGLNNSMASNKLLYEQGSFSFINGNNDMLFSPNDVFASIV